MKKNDKKKFDCLKMKDDIQARIYNKIRSLSWEEEKKYFEASANKYLSTKEQKRLA